jgi:hypothetical protein
MIEMATFGKTTAALVDILTQQADKIEREKLMVSYSSPSLHAHASLFVSWHS